MEEKKMRKQMVALLAGAMLIMGMATAASALQIKFQQTGFADLVVNDVDSDGSIEVNNLSYGNFKITFIGGNSSLPGNPGANTLYLSDFKIMNTFAGAKTLTTSISDTGYSLNPLYSNPDNALFNFAVSGQSNVASTSASFKSYLDTTNALFGTAQNLGTWNPNPLSTASSNTISTLTSVASNPFSLTEVISVTQGKSINDSHFSQFSAGIDVAPVPEPGTMMLLGIGMLGMAVYGKRRMNKEA
jgi:hypothetical protein